MVKQVCKKCGEEKFISEFNKHSKYKSGYRSSCRVCDSIAKKEWKKNNPEKVREERKRWKKNNPDKVKESRINYRQKIKDLQKSVPKNGGIIKNVPKKHVQPLEEKIKYGCVCIGCKVRKPIGEFYRVADTRCKECEKIRMKEYRTNFPLQRKGTKDKWKNNNLELVKKLKKNHFKRRMKNDPVFRAITYMRRRLYSYSKKKNIKKETPFMKIIGITPEGFRDHISSMFKEGMSWDNYGMYTWHLDHIIPISTATTMEELERLSHYTNIQPLWREENIEKSNKIL